ncbi:hypothetical protein AAKU52_003141 [Pedobacter sp. CG_S7]|uniref:AlbA family DNA-binding domain-containing protein n=1 Tax=Pedobacter sp. CG_S7 TaxID=3143930 RepID=UPI0033976117
MIGYSNIYLGKALHELNYEDIETFFKQEHIESETLEFKSYSTKGAFDDQLNKGIIRGINAFLNSSGGILIWGSPVGTKPEGRSEEIFVGELSPVNILKEKDALINMISSRISPLPIGISVQILEREENYLYVFEVQQSISKPHQFNERYYVRLDGQSKPAPHYLVDALFKQIKYPEIGGYIKFEKANYDDLGNLTLSISVFICNFSQLQNEEKISYQIVVVPGTIDRNGNGVYHSELTDVLHFGKPIRNGFNISITGHEYINKLSIIKFMLSFGGKLSPAKISSYTLKLKQLPDNHKNANSLITEIEENVLFSDHQKKLGKGKETFIKDILER